MDSTTKDKITAGVCIILFVMCLILLVFVGIKLFSPITEDIGPYTVPQVPNGYEVTVTGPIVFESYSPFSLTNVDTKEVIKPNRSAPAIGEQNSQYIVTDPTYGTYRISTFDEINIYSLTPSQVAVKLNIFYGLGALVIFIIMIGILYIGLAYLAVTTLKSLL